MLDRRTTCAVRTPVCLRDFCDYVMEEEGCWLKRQRQGSEENLRHRIVLAGFERGEPLFRDEDFLLPGSIKAQQFELLDTPDSESFQSILILYNCLIISNAKIFMKIEMKN